MVQMTLFNISSTQTVEQPKTNNIQAETKILSEKALKNIQRKEALKKEALKKAEARKEATRNRKTVTKEQRKEKEAKKQEARRERTKETQQGIKIQKEILMAIDDELLSRPFMEVVEELEEIESIYQINPLTESEIIGSLMVGIADKEFIHKAVLNKIFNMTFKEVLFRYGTHLTEEFKELVLN